MKFARLVGVFGLAAMAFGLASNAAAQPGGQGGSGGPGGFGRMMNNPMMLLRSEQIQKELEIVEDQLKEIETIGEDMRESFQGMRDMSQEERETKMTEINKDFQTRVNEILLPHQQKRLKQIGLQMAGRGRDGAAGSLTEGDLSKELKITDEQKAKLKEVAEKARINMEEKTKKLREEFESEILAVLTDEQRAQYKEMVGDTIELDQRQMFQGGRGGQRGQGGRGGRSGNQSDF